MPATEYDEAGRRAFVSDLTDRLGVLAANSHIGLAALAPLGEGRKMTWITAPDQSSSAVLVQPVSAGYFDALGIPIIAGRNFVAADAEVQSVLVNETMARRLWPDRSPVGQAIQAGSQRREVVGVVRDAQINALGVVEPTLFEPYAGGGTTVIVLRSESTTRGAELIGLVRQLEPRAAAAVAPMTRQIERALGPSRSAATVAAMLGLLALVLATVGVYGVISYTVEQRRREIGVRVALGAAPAQIIRGILRTNSRPLLIGLTVGASISVLLAGVLRATLPGVSGLDPVIWGGVLTMMFFAGIAASIAPARRAARVDPMRALRTG